MSAAEALLHPFLYESPLPKHPSHINALKKLDIYKKIMQRQMSKIEGKSRQFKKQH